MGWGVAFGAMWPWVRSGLPLSGEVLGERFSLYFPGVRTRPFFFSSHSEVSLFFISFLFFVPESVSALCHAASFPPDKVPDMQPG